MTNPQTELKVKIKALVDKHIYATLQAQHSNPLEFSLGDLSKVLSSELLDVIDQQLTTAADTAREEALNDININKTLIAVPEGYKFIQVTHVGRILSKPIKDINNGSQFKEIYLDEALQQDTNE